VAGEGSLLVEPLTEEFTKAMREGDSMDPPKPTKFSWEQAAKETATILLS